MMRQLTNIASSSPVLVILLCSICTFPLAQCAQYPNSPDSDPPSQWSSMSSVFTQHCSPFGVSMFAQGWSEAKFRHACNMMAQMLDNDQDGCADDELVVKHIRARQAGMVLFKSEDTYENYEEDVSPTFAGQWLFEEETQPGCSGNQETTNCRDASIEEIFHVITSSGIGGAYPSDYSVCDDSSLSTMQQEMDIARGGHFDSVPTTYPSDAIYHYYDKTCDYSCQGTEFIYWALTTLLGGQDSRDNDVEWEVKDAAELQTKAPGIYNLLVSDVTSMKLISRNGVLPGAGANGATSTYNPSSQTCNSGGCGLDGSGCGSQGNEFDLDRCSIVIDDTPAPTPTAFTPAPTPTSFTPAPTPTVNTPFPTQSNCKDNPNFRKGKKQKKCAFFGKKNVFKRCRRPGVIPNCPESCDVCDKNGEEVCEGRNLKRKACVKINCCQWSSEENECYSEVGRDICFSASSNIFI